MTIFAQNDNLKKVMRSFKIFEKDLQESFVCSPGAGGQNVNKVATCVLLRHKPTGIQVKCHQERSQALNRILAREVLVEKIKQLRQKQAQEKISAIQKEKRKNRKRSIVAKENMLQDKRRLAQKKSLRKKTIRIFDD